MKKDIYKELKECWECTECIDLKQHMEVCNLSLSYEIARSNKARTRIGQKQVKKLPIPTYGVER